MKQTAKHRNTAGLKPFRKGPDSRRWKHGQKSKAAVATTRDIQQWLSIVGEEIYEEGRTYNECLVRKLWEKAVKGDMQAVTIVLERILGKAPQPLSGDLNIKAKLSMADLRKSQKESENGS